MLQSNQAPTPGLLKPVHPRAHAPQQKRLPQWEAHAPQLGTGPACHQPEKSLHSKEDPAQPKLNKYIFKNVKHNKWLTEPLLGIYIPDMLNKYAKYMHKDIQHCTMYNIKKPEESLKTNKRSPTGLKN